jgi:hypothetical protein
MNQFAYQLPAYMFHFGPIAASDVETAKAEIRRRLGVTRLPRGLKVWDTAVKPMDRYRFVQEPLLEC